MVLYLYLHIVANSVANKTVYRPSTDIEALPASVNFRCLVLCCVVLSFVLSCVVLSFVLSCVVLRCVVLPCLALPCLALSSCPSQFQESLSLYYDTRTASLLYWTALDLEFSNCNGLQQNTPPNCTVYWLHQTVSILYIRMHQTAFRRIMLGPTLSDAISSVKS